MLNPIGNLEPVEPATVWKSEPGEFVPWLASEQNLRRLGDAMGLQLEPVAEEAQVGRFRADLVCRDRVTGATVVIEAQLAPTDHSHLGQLLTYAQGLGAHIAVWLATGVHDEHRAVLDRLNRIGGADLRCFAVEMRLWKIGPSAAAPQFTVVAGPGYCLPADPEDRPRLDKNLIRAGRLRRGMTAEQLAKAAGISRAYLSQIEAGRYRGSAETRSAIARALGMPSLSMV